MSDIILPNNRQSRRAAVAQGRNEGRVLPPNEAALVTRNGMQSLEMLLPEGARDVPPITQFLAAVALRAATDKGFVTECLNWFHARKGSH